MFTAQINPLIAIITIHHDKPEDSRIPTMVMQMTESPMKSTLNSTASDRQKRLLPYVNYYVDNNYNHPTTNQQQNNNNYQQEHDFLQYQQNYNNINQPQQQQQQTKQIKFTPFLESNALPGQFRPMIINNNKNQQIEYEPSSPTIINSRVPPNYSTIYDKLAQLKLAQHIQLQPVYVQNYAKPQQIHYIPRYSNNQQYNRIIQPPSKTTNIETYTPTNIDISPSPHSNNYNQNYEAIQNYRHNKPFVHQQIAVDIPQQSNYYDIDDDNNNEEYQNKPNNNQQQIVYLRQKPLTQYPEKNYVQFIPVKKPIIYLQRKPSSVTSKSQQQIITIVDEAAQKFAPNSNIDDQLEKYVPTEHPFESQKYQTTSRYEEIPITTFQQDGPTTTISDNPNSLSHILKQLQESNMLPHTLTPDNIDNSIKTLVKILTNLKQQQQKFSQPIIVPDDENVEVEMNLDHLEEIKMPESVIQSFPIDTVEGGTPGKPGIDYPALSTIPQTTFSCKTQRYKGFFGDPDTNCQVINIYLK